MADDTWQPDRPLLQGKRGTPGGELPCRQSLLAVLGVPLIGIGEEQGLPVLVLAEITDDGLGFIAHQPVRELQGRILVDLGEFVGIDPDDGDKVEHDGVVLHQTLTVSLRVSQVARSIRV